MCEGAIIKGNQAGDHGGGFYARDATRVHSSCDLIENVAPQGAAIYLTNVKSATFENNRMTDNLASGGSVAYVAVTEVFARGVTLESSPSLGDGSSTRAIETDGDSIIVLHNCSCVGWHGDAVIYHMNADNGSLVLNSCDFSNSSPIAPIVAPNSVAEIRNAVISSKTFENAGTGTQNSSLALVSRVMDCSDPNACGPGFCVDGIIGVLCECLRHGECLNDGGELSLSLKTPPAEMTYSPELVCFELLISAGYGTTYIIWDLNFESVHLDLVVVPSTGVLPPGTSITVEVIGAPSKQDVGGNLTSIFSLTSIGSAISDTAGAVQMEVNSTFYLCQAGEYARPAGDYANGVSCEACATVGDGMVLDCERPGATLASLPIRQGYWRPNLTSPIVFECLHTEACKGATKVSSPDDYCEVGYRGPCEFMNGQFVPSDRLAFIWPMNSVHCIYCCCYGTVVVNCVAVRGQ